MAISLTCHLNGNAVNLTEVTAADIGAFVTVAQLFKGQFGITLTSITDEHRLQKRALADALGKKVEVKKLTEAVNPMFGWDYQRVVTNRISKEGGDPNAFTTQAPFGKKWVPNLYGIMLESEKEPGKFYVRSYQTKATKYRSCYLVDGTLATPAEDAAIRSCLRDVSHSQKQGLAGLDEDNEVMPRDYSLCNIYGLFWQAKEIVTGGQTQTVAFGKTYDQIVASL